MATVAELRMDVDTRSVRKAGDDLSALSGKAKQAEQAAGKLSGNARKAGTELGSLGKAARGAGAGFASLAGSAVTIAGISVALNKAAQDFSKFEAGFSKVETLFDETSFAAGGLEANIAKLRSGMLNLRSVSGEGFDTLSKGLFDLVSAGVQAGDAMRVLNDANTLAKAGATDISVAVDGLTTSLNAYGIEAARSETIAAKFFTAQKFGKTTVEELARGLGQVAPLASQLGVSLDELFASQAAATSVGIRQSEAFTGLKAVLTNIVKPAGDAAEEARRLGVGFDAASLKAKGLTQFLKDIQSSANFTEESFQRLFGSAEALNFVLGVTGGGAGVYARTLAELGDETKSVETLLDAYKRVANDSAEVSKRLGGTIEAISVAIGAGLAPSINKFTTSLDDFLRGDDFEARLQSISASAESVALIISGLTGIVGDLVGELAKAARLLNLEVNGGIFREAADRLRARGEQEAAERLLRETQGNAAAGQARIMNDPALFREREAILRTMPSLAVPGEAITSANQLQAALMGVGKAASGAADSTATIANAASAANDNAGKLKTSMGAVEKSLRASVADAQALFDAAEAGGSAGFEAELRKLELAKEAAAAVEKAAAAGESLSLAQATMLVTARKELGESTDALLEAEAKMKDAARNRFESRISGAVGRAQELVDFKSGGGSRIGLGNMGEILLWMRQQMGPTLESISRDIRRSTDLTEEEKADYEQRLDAELVGMEKAVRDGVIAGNKGAPEGVKLTFNESLGQFADNIARPIEDAFLYLRDALDSLFDGTKKSFDKIAATLGGAFKGLGGAFSDLGKNLSGGLGDIFSAIGGFLGPVGSILGAAGAIGGFFKSLFGRRTAIGTVDLASGAISGTKDSSKEGGERNERRDAVLETVADAAGAIAELIGASIAKGFKLDVAAGSNSITTTLKNAAGQVVGTTSSGKDDVEGAIGAALKVVIDKAFSGGDATLAAFAKEALNAGRSLEDVISVLQALKVAAETNNQAINDYAIAAAKAGRSAESIVDGINGLAAVFALTKKPLSDIEAGLKQIDDAINPVVADLQSLGQAIEGISQIGKDAALALGENFIDGIRQLNVELQNSVLGQFNKLIKEIEQREKDARLLLERGAITSEQFGFVQSTSGLQVSKFFEGLSEDDKESIADFFGLLRDASGDIAVARVRLEEQFKYLIDNVEETARGFEEAARNFERFSNNLKATADSIRSEFSGLTPKANVETLQGRVNELLNQARAGNQSAFEALPQVVNSLVQTARQAFGGSEQFATIRDFGLSALDEAASIADALAKQNADQAIGAREDVRILADIRELLNDDRQLSTLQDILDEGKLTNSLIAQQLQSFLTLMQSAGSNLNQITPEQLQQAAQEYLIAQQQIANASAGTSSGATSPTASPTSGSLVTNDQLAQIIADNAAASDRLATSNRDIANVVEDLTFEIRRERLLEQNVG